MTAEEMLVLLKLDLQLTTTANDSYLSFLLNTADKFAQREGAEDDGSVEYAAIIIQYAAYLFRKRAISSAGKAEGETAMPRFLRYALNNLILSQKAGAS